MSFTYHRTIRFSDTDAAGVVYFANVLSICHEAYEYSLAASGIELLSFFSNPAVVIPIIHASVDFLRPMVCGDAIVIRLTPQRLNENKFEITYEIVAASSEQLLAKAMTRHVCIEPTTRNKLQLPDEIVEWLYS
ncbi:thioesterase family protein [Allocoleopsis sp.]|uniref:acyl-CoA thioesterase n=1 Tax=Allocoleopsis sp. TaxID=3088169 RepID=UPI002FD02802